MRLAQITNPVLPSKISGADVSGVGLLVSNLIGLLFIIAFLLAFFFLIIGGIQWVTSGGDKAGMEAARDKITHAIMGLIIVAAAWAVMMLVGQFLGITFPNLPIPSIGG